MSPKRDQLGWFETRHTGRRDVRVPLDGLGRQRGSTPIDMAGVSLRADGDNPDAVGFRGHAAVFGSPTWIGSRQHGYQEVVAAGAFAKTLQEADVRFLLNHDPNYLLARNKSGTLTLSEDRTGLYAEADMAPTSYTRDLAVLMERGDLTQMSFAFETVRDEWTEEEAEDGTHVFEKRSLLELKLWDVSVVTYPAYDDTDAALRAKGFDLLCEEQHLDPSDVLRRANELDPRPPTGTDGRTNPAPPEGTRDDSKPHPDRLDLYRRRLAINERSLDLSGGSK